MAKAYCFVSHVRQKQLCVMTPLSFIDDYTENCENVHSCKLIFDDREGMILLALLTLHA